MSPQNPVSYDYLETEIGLLVIAASEEGLRHVFFQDEIGEKQQYPSHWVRDASRQVGVLQEAIVQLRQYFDGRRRLFSLPLAPQGTSFQQTVWQALCEIPYGQTISYAQLAERVESPRAYRAVGNANGQNPLVVLQPCHRVVAADGSLGGFSSGLHRKRFLLDLEKRARLF